MGTISLALSPDKKHEKIQKFIKFVLAQNHAGVEREDLLSGLLPRIPWANRAELEAALEALLTSGKVQEESK